ncbi:hypothetical protein VNO77_27330 [Canavalia gladiata]|uniref:Uncharacterized protein n=1 Tax=Canavalia gladiata TaxID=3824 RepID=A0AAN9KUK1_CANGL
MEKPVLVAHEIDLDFKFEDLDPCKWKGIKHDLKTKRVTYLNLSHHQCAENYQLTETLSTELGTSFFQIAELQPGLQLSNLLPLCVSSFELLHGSQLSLILNFQPDSASHKSILTIFYPIS